MRKTETILIALVMILAACDGGPAKPTVTDAQAANSNGTVYDERQREESESGSDYSDETISPDEDIYEERLGSAAADSGQALEADLDWEPIYFGFDEASLSAQAREDLARYARVLRTTPGIEVLLEGHCDTRGTEDYNLALGERRAQTVRHYLNQLGVEGDVLRTISYGELKPQDPRQNEQSWGRNRRVAFTFPPASRN